MLIRGKDDNIYGYGTGADISCCGSVFRVSPAGKFETLHVFKGRHSFDLFPECIAKRLRSRTTDGAKPKGLVEATKGTFYGITMFGGIYSQSEDGGGTLFRLVVPTDK